MCTWQISCHFQWSSNIFWECNSVVSASAFHGSNIIVEISEFRCGYVETDAINNDVT